MVAELTARGNEVTCLMHKTSRIDPAWKARPEGHYQQVTVLDSLPPAISGQDIVYHVAGCTQALAPRQFYRVNQRGVANIAQVFSRPNEPARVGLGFFAGGGGACNRTGVPQDRIGPFDARLALWTQQAGRRTGGPGIRRPSAHHDRPAADRLGRGRPAGPAAVPFHRGLPFTWCPASIAAAFR